MSTIQGINPPHNATPQFHSTTASHAKVSQINKNKNVPQIQSVPTQSTRGNRSQATQAIADMLAKDKATMDWPKYLVYRLASARRTTDAYLRNLSCAMTEIANVSHQMKLKAEEEAISQLLVDQTEHKEGRERKREIQRLLYKIITQSDEEWAKRWEAAAKIQQYWRRYRVRRKTKVDAAVKTIHLTRRNKTPELTMEMAERAIAAARRAKARCWAKAFPNYASDGGEMPDPPSDGEIVVPPGALTPSRQPPSGTVVVSALDALFDSAPWVEPALAKKNAENPMTWTPMAEAALEVMKNGVVETKAAQEAARLARLTKRQGSRSSALREAGPSMSGSEQSDQGMLAQGVLAARSSAALGRRSTKRRSTGLEQSSFARPRPPPDPLPFQLPRAPRVKDGPEETAPEPPPTLSTLPPVPTNPHQAMIPTEASSLLASANLSAASSSLPIGAAGNAPEAPAPERPSSPLSDDINLFLQRLATDGNTHGVKERRKSKKKKVHKVEMGEGEGAEADAESDEEAPAPKDRERERERDRIHFESLTLPKGVERKLRVMVTDNVPSTTATPRKKRQSRQSSMMVKIPGGTINKAEDPPEEKRPPRTAPVVPKGPRMAPAEANGNVRRAPRTAPASPRARASRVDRSQSWAAPSKAAASAPQEQNRAYSLSVVETHLPRSSRQSKTLKGHVKKSRQSRRRDAAAEGGGFAYAARKAAAEYSDDSEGHTYSGELSKEMSGQDSLNFLPMGSSLSVSTASGMGSRPHTRTKSRARSRIFDSSSTTSEETGSGSHTDASSGFGAHSDSESDSKSDSDDKEAGSSSGEESEEPEELDDEAENELLERLVNQLNQAKQKAEEIAAEVEANGPEVLDGDVLEGLAEAKREEMDAISHIGALVAGMAERELHSGGKGGRGGKSGAGSRSGRSSKSGRGSKSGLSSRATSAKSRTSSRGKSSFRKRGKPARLASEEKEPVTRVKGKSLVTTYERPIATGESASGGETDRNSPVPLGQVAVQGSRRVSLASSVRWRGSGDFAGEGGDSTDGEEGRRKNHSSLKKARPRNVAGTVGPPEPRHTRFDEPSPAANPVPAANLVPATMDNGVAPTIDEAVALGEMLLSEPSLSGPEVTGAAADLAGLMAGGASAEDALSMMAEDLLLSVAGNESVAGTVAAMLAPLLKPSTPIPEFSHFAFPTHTRHGSLPTPTGLRPAHALSAAAAARTNSAEAGLSLMGQPLGMSSQWSYAAPSGSPEHVQQAVPLATNYAKAVFPFLRNAGGDGPSPFANGLLGSSFPMLSTRGLASRRPLPTIAEVAAESSSQFGPVIVAAAPAGKPSLYAAKYPLSSVAPTPQVFAELKAWTPRSLSTILSCSTYEDTSDGGRDEDYEEVEGSETSVDAQRNYRAPRPPFPIPTMRQLTAQLAELAQLNPLLASRLHFLLIWHAFMLARSAPPQRCALGTASHAEHIQRMATLGILTLVLMKDGDRRQRAVGGHSVSRPGYLHSINYWSGAVMLTSVEPGMAGQVAGSLQVSQIKPEEQRQPPPKVAAPQQQVHTNSEPEPESLTLPPSTSRPGWSFTSSDSAPTHRSHRSKSKDLSRSSGSEDADQTSTGTNQSVTALPLISESSAKSKARSTDSVVIPSSKSPRSSNVTSGQGAEANARPDPISEPPADLRSSASSLPLITRSSSTAVLSNALSMGSSASLSIGFNSITKPALNGPIASSSSTSAATAAGSGAISATGSNAPVAAGPATHAAPGSGAIASARSSAAAVTGTSATAVAGSGVISGSTQAAATAAVRLEIVVGSKMTLEPLCIVPSPRPVDRSIGERQQTLAPLASELRGSWPMAAADVSAAAAKQPPTSWRLEAAAIANAPYNKSLQKLLSVGTSLLEDSRGGGGRRRPYPTSAAAARGEGAEKAAAWRSLPTLKPVPSAAVTRKEAAIAALALSPDKFVAFNPTLRAAS